MKKMKRIYKFIIPFIVVILISCLIYESRTLRESVYIVFLSFIIAYILKPMHKTLMNKNIKKGTAAAVLIFLFIMILLLAIVFIIPSIIKESLSVNTTESELYKYITMINNKLKPINDNKILNTVVSTIYEKGNKQIVHVFNKMFDWMVNIGTNSVEYAIVPIISYYFLADGDNIENKVIVMFPTSWRATAKKILSDIDKILSRYVVSQLLLCILVSLLTFIVLYFLHIDYPVILSILNGLFNIIPYFGPIFGIVPVVIVALLESPKTALWALFWMYAIQQIEGNIISPKVTSDAISIHPLLVIIILIVGGKLGGFAGMVLAIPISVVIKVIYEDLNYYLF
ncbi:MAG: AI-2E family transporter [Bacillota bacterium]|nr:AI-2E family transporter [Bacillota bacterium]